MAKEAVKKPRPKEDIKPPADPVDPPAAPVEEVWTIVSDEGDEQHRRVVRRAHAPKGGFVFQCETDHFDANGNVMACSQSMVYFKG